MKMDQKAKIVKKTGQFFITEELTKSAMSAANGHDTEVRINT
jgi:hypothetical protein